MPASASAIPSSAKRRAFWIRVRFWESEKPRAMRNQWPGRVAVPSPSAQKRAICVWSAVRVVLSTLPSDFTSLKAAV